MHRRSRVEPRISRAAREAPSLSSFSLHLSACAVRFHNGFGELEAAARPRNFQCPASDDGPKKRIPEVPSSGPCSCTEASADRSGHLLAPLTQMEKSGGFEAGDEGLVLAPEFLGQTVAELLVGGTDQGGFLAPDFRIDGQQQVELILGKAKAADVEGVA